MSKKKQESVPDDLVIKTLKEKYFALARKEQIGLTKEITKEVDNLQEAIKKLLAEQANKEANS
jgi:hypothetical protein